MLKRILLGFSKEAREHNKRYEIHMKSKGDELSKEIYRAAKNSYHSKLISWKNNLYAQKITEAKSDSKEMFKIVKRLSGRGD